MCLISGYPASSLQGKDGNAHAHTPANWGKGGRASDNIVFECTPFRCTRILTAPVGPGWGLRSSHWQEHPQRPSNYQECPEQQARDQERAASCNHACSGAAIQTRKLRPVDTMVPISYPPPQGLWGGATCKGWDSGPGGEGGEEIGWHWSGLDDRKETEA